MAKDPIVWLAASMRLVLKRLEKLEESSDGTCFDMGITTSDAVGRLDRCEKRIESNLESHGVLGKDASVKKLCDKLDGVDWSRTRGSIGVTRLEKQFDRLDRFEIQIQAICALVTQSLGDDASAKKHFDKLKLSNLESHGVLGEDASAKKLRDKLDGVDWSYTQGSTGVAKSQIELINLLDDEIRQCDDNDKLQSMVSFNRFDQLCTHFEQAGLKNGQAFACACGWFIHLRDNMLHELDDEPGYFDERHSCDSGTDSDDTTTL